VRQRAFGPGALPVKDQAHADRPMCDPFGGRRPALQ
jgi:hypothetical protein